MAHRTIREKRFLTIIHVATVLSMLLPGAILSLAAVAWPYQLPIVLILVLILIPLYVRFRMDPRVIALSTGLSMALCGWIFTCEHIVTLDNLLGTRFSERLRLGVRLSTYVSKTLHSENLTTREACCGDALTWRYQPGSIHRWTFDCPTCSKPYATVVDPTGYLNGQPALAQSRQIDLFVAGDSVLQGMGAPSALEFVRAELPVRMWNLSIAAYGARQKVNALLTYALSKQPRWLILEFYAGNDLPEAIQDDLCADAGDFRCRYNPVELEWRSAHHPVYSSMAEVRTHIIATLAYYSADNLTLTITGVPADAIKGGVKRALGPFVTGRSSGTARDEVSRTPAAPVVFAKPPFPLREGHWAAYLQAGMAAIEREYRRLWSALESTDIKPTVVLLYSPVKYEVYQGQGLEPLPEMDRTSAFQRTSISAFARTFGWRFLDLTEPLREEVKARQAWLYGVHDQVHLSPEGTVIMASVLAAQLSKVIVPPR